MKFLNQALAAMRGLGLKRAIPLLVALAVFAGLLTASFVLFNKPSRQVLYSGLTPDDVNQIGMVLSEANVPFDVNEAGTSVLVDYGKTAQARMILAEKGLPKSDKSGYALFDQMGSLGLTSFMQQITRVRALEGELVRTIQQLDGIKTARVHLAMKPDNTFKTKEDQPTASVVIRTVGRPSEQTIGSIRQIVAAAIPGMLPDHVTVMTTDGTMLSSGSAGGGEEDKMLELEKSVSQSTQDRIERTLAPVAGMNNVRVSVTTDLNTDKRQINETNFDPDSKVERSMRTIKSSDQSSDAGNNGNISVDQNIPQEVKPGSGADANSKKKESNEQTVNYELNSKQTATESNGYRVDKQSIAVVINKQALVKLLGGTADQSKIDAQVKDIEDTVKSAAGYDDKRGDTIHVTAVDFAPEDATLEPLAGPSFMELIKGNLGTMINGLFLLITSVVVLMLGVKPVLKFLADMGATAPEAPAMLGGGDMMAGALPPGGMGDAGMGGGMGMPATADFGAAFGLSDNPNLGDDPRARLNRVVGGDVNRAAQVLKQWLADGKEAA